jgi:AcrR family transcriptional regulator
LEAAAFGVSPFPGSAAGAAPVQPLEQIMPRILTPTDVAEFRNRLCEVGTQLFAERGFEGFNMRELAQRLGVSAMTPYRYFKDKEAIMSEIRVRAFARFADWLEEQLAAADADDATLSHAYARYAIQEQAQYRLMFDLIQPASATFPALAVQERRVRALLTAHLRALADRELISGDPELLSLVLWSVLHGAAVLYLSGKLSRQDFDLSLSNAVRLVMGCAVEAKDSALESTFSNGHAASWLQSKPLTQPRAQEAGI